ncbi:MAG: NAD(P)-dependent oxidoreductase [Thalassobaculum sp.]|uniref:NAD-dependent epimerase/dehydratase family protein n=1 Tax=Thalassobaculum sp. TaxID=2022740 RepID=UPI0032EDC032
MAGPRVLVTGGGGLLGTHVVAAMTPDHAVEVLDLRRPAADVTFRPVDMRDLEAVRSAVRGHDRVIHLAGIDDGTDVSEHRYMEVNVQGTWNLLHACEEAGVAKVVIASSSAAFGFNPRNPPDYLPIDEAHPLRPTRTYDLTKALIEQVAESFARRGGIGSILCLRPTLVLRPEKAREILAELSTLSPEEGNPGVAVDAPRYGDLPAHRCYVTSRDAAAAFRAATLAGTAPFARYVIAARDTLGGVAALPWIDRIYGRRPPVRDPDWFAAETASPLDSRAAERDLGWLPDDDWAAVVGTALTGDGAAA